MMFYFPLNSILGFEGEEEKFVRGVAALRDFFCVGCSTGNILVFSCKEGGNFPLLHNLESEKIAMSSLASSPTLLVGANDNGKIFGYSGSDAFEQTFTFPGYGSPCTSLCLRDSLLLAGYSTGHIRGFRTDIMELMFEITAHTRAVTALSLGPGGSELASCSQDQYLHVWALPDYRSSASSRVSLLYSQCLENKMCTGVAFLSGGRLCVSAYDEEEISLFRKMK
jgi:WD40 repeat protein